ncbi:type II toxin-antitoxin system death-on-curing family toxin [Rubinisphaera sp.]|nr:type II toxin-antitoxin system death-on-curing family toxin [Rubinisphaera sp.]MBV10077.1 type II toxin-antitoxin system death-on-curing family toxin [Rubinisphaera sp.]HCS50606.1 type II toxin-antitoxin system death-on-curing family toxin [Planctomycetaceae bacterium]|tara:strand:+ start:852 stop:1250 length:399 start_codon:yes stop_codon:yes gene_type:complete
MRYLSLSEVLVLHRQVLEQSGGGSGIRDFGAIESAVAQPQLRFHGQDLYVSIEEKATALCYSLVGNHPFVDGNKRIGHAAMEAFLYLNGSEIKAGLEESERVILDLAAGILSRDSLLEWIRIRIKKLDSKNK